MILNLEHRQPEQPSLHAPLVFIHGLFGSMGNLGVLARAFEHSHEIIQVDVRNHGRSPRSSALSYDEMAQDILDSLDHLKIEQFSVVGHSMGGKIAMTLAKLAAQRLHKLVVLDMAPYAYQENHHDTIFQALFAVQNAQLATRKQATELMQTYIKENMVIQFLLKSWSQGQWLFNVDALYTHYADILSWQPQPAWLQPALFVRGGNSHYVSQDIQIAAVQQQFPQAQIETIQNAGHWLHAEQPVEVVKVMKDYINQI
ncbi:alpha/beta fold hydrolase [Acinetobacter rudis]|uniref:alpha/beta fold hydrolase n=1 Tax=Acinetobacter rudis TaxID=632955 RepID=UPI00280CD603|nr:alpha/beta fold hydrolase [Acinetobacter rudis]MDQ8954444.1 alpha/beta fold hydrolase [Acinetobacter rudis]